MVNPAGWDSLVYSIVRDKNINGLISSIDGTFSFHGDAYQYLYTLFNSQGYCSLIEVRVLQSSDEGQTFTTFYEGIIFLSDIKFDELNGTAKTKIQDDSFYAKINNNKSIGSLPFVAKSKSGNTITAATQTAVEFFRPSTGVPYVNSGTHGGHCFTVFECFKHSVAFMTDGAVTFASDTFDAGGELEGLVVTSGKVLGNVQSIPGMTQTEFESDFPLISFEDLFKNVHKKYNLGLIIEKSGSNIILRIETKDYFYGETSAITFSDVGKVVSSVATDAIFSKLDIGSSELLDAGSFNENQLFLGFKNESYHIVEQCNIDSTLDLVSSWIISSNIIEDCVVNQASDYNDNLFLIDCSVVYGAYAATKTNWLTTAPPYYYNEALINSNVLPRFFASIPAPIALYLGSVDNTSEATKGFNDLVAIPTFDTFDYDTESSDPGNNYNPASYKYTAQADGSYSFDVQAKFKVTRLTLFSSSYAANIIAYRYNAANSLQSTHPIDDIPLVPMPNLSDTFELHNSVSFYMDNTDYVIIKYAVYGSGIGTSFYKLAGGYFKCTATPESGGIVTNYDPSDYPVIRHEFEYPLGLADFFTIQGDPKKLITFAMDGQANRDGWIESIKYSPEKGSAKFILNSSKNLNN